MEHTGQGQIIRAEALTQDSNGNWVAAKAEYHSSWLDKIGCRIFRWHKWSFDLQRLGRTLVVPDMIPSHARCVKCGTFFGV